MVPRLGLAALLGLVLGIGLAAWAETVRPTVPGAARVARLLDAPLLGTLAGGCRGGGRRSAGTAGRRPGRGAHRRARRHGSAAAAAARGGGDRRRRTADTYDRPGRGLPTCRPRHGSSPTSSPAPAPSQHRAPARHRTPAQHRTHPPRGARRPDRRYGGRGAGARRWAGGTPGAVAAGTTGVPEAGVDGRPRERGGGARAPAGRGDRPIRANQLRLAALRIAGGGAPAAVPSGRSTPAARRRTGRTPPGVRVRRPRAGRRVESGDRPRRARRRGAPVSRLSAVRAVRDLLTVSAWPLLGVGRSARRRGWPVVTGSSRPPARWSR